jgi:hypothetical protein
MREMNEEEGGDAPVFTLHQGAQTLCKKKTS